jgi:hypothetical protein
MTAWNYNADNAPRYSVSIPRIGACAMSRLKHLAISVLFLCLVFGALSVYAVDENMAEPSAADFEGQIVWVILKESIAIQNNPPSQVVKDAALREVGGRMFLVGTVEPHPETTDRAAPAGKVGIAWDCVQQFYVYSSEEYGALKQMWQDNRDE